MRQSIEMGAPPDEAVRRHGDEGLHGERASTNPIAQAVEVRMHRSAVVELPAGGLRREPLARTSRDDGWHDA